MSPLEIEALYALLYPLRDKLRISIKWQKGASEARLLGPGIKVRLGGWDYAAPKSRVVVGARRPGYTSFSLLAGEHIRGDSHHWWFLALLPSEIHDLLDRLRTHTHEP